MNYYAKVALATVMVMGLIWACKPEKDQPTVKSNDKQMMAKASNNASWQGILSSNKSTFEPQMDTIRRALMGIMQDPQVTPIIKEYMYSNMSDSTFGYRLTLSKLNDLCAEKGIVLHVKLGQKMCAEYPGKGLPEMCGSITKYMINGIDLSGNIVMPAIWIPYYDTSAFSTPNWNLLGVNRITVNNPYAKKNVGIQYWNVNGTSGNENNENNFLGKIQWVLDWTEIPENEKPFAQCRCDKTMIFTEGGHTVEQKEECRVEGEGGKCGFSWFKANCTNDCSQKIKVNALD